MMILNNHHQGKWVELQDKWTAVYHWVRCECAPAELGDSTNNVRGQSIIQFIPESNLEIINVENKPIFVTTQRVEE